MQKFRRNKKLDIWVFIGVSHIKNLYRPDYFWEWKNACFFFMLSYIEEFGLLFLPKYTFFFFKISLWVNFFRLLTVAKKVVFFDEVRYLRNFVFFFTFFWQSNEKKVDIWVFIGVSHIKKYIEAIVFRMEECWLLFHDIIYRRVRSNFSSKIYVPFFKYLFEAYFLEFWLWLWLVR